MISQHPIITFDIATSQQNEVRQRVEAARLAGLAEPNRLTIASEFRRKVGLTLVRFGEYLQRTHCRPATGDVAAVGGALRIAR